MLAPTRLFLKVELCMLKKCPTVLWLVLMRLENLTKVTFCSRDVEGEILIDPGTPTFNSLSLVSILVVDENLQVEKIHIKCSETTSE